MRGFRHTMSPRFMHIMMGRYFNMIDQNNILDFFVKSECEILTEEQINDPTIPTPITSTIELYDRYNEWVMCLGLDPGADAEDDKGDAIKGIYLKTDTPAAKRLAARGKKYPKFRETVEYEKWRKEKNKMKKAIDQLEHYANREF